MTIRWQAGDSKGVTSGYEGPVPEDFTLPSCGIVDVDKALLRMFDKDILFEVQNAKSGLVKVPVIFAAGEKWAMFKKGTPIRDKAGTFILPLISIMRTNIEQGVEDICGRGINQQTGELIIKRRLDPSDRLYQNLLNKLGIVNQVNVANTQVSGSVAGQPGITTTRINAKLNQFDTDVVDGGLLSPKFRDNIWEFISIPAPQFYTATYEVVFWTQYTDHMNQMIEKLLSSYLPQGPFNNALKLETEKGYWFIASVENNAFMSEINTDELSEKERIVRYKFTVKVPAYLLASSAPGVPVPVRRHVSAPTIIFSIGDVNELVGQDNSIDVDPFNGADDPSATLPTTWPRANRC